MATDDFDNEANLLAHRQWVERRNLLMQRALENLPARLARVSEAREFGGDDPMLGLPETLLRGIEEIREDPESTIRSVVAIQRASLEMIVEMMQAHWQETGTTLSPQ